MHDARQPNRYTTPEKHRSVRPPQACRVTARDPCQPATRACFTKTRRGQRAELIVESREVVRERSQDRCSRVGILFAHDVPQVSLSLSRPSPVPPPPLSFFLFSADVRPYIVANATCESTLGRNRAACSRSLGMERAWGERGGSGAGRTVESP